MSVQLVLEVVKLQHVFWDKELCRAAEEELKDCRFFRQQCEDEIAHLEYELATPATHRAPDRLPLPEAPKRRLSNTPPTRTMIGGRTMNKKTTQQARKTIR